MESFKNKKIILTMTNDVGLYSCIEKNLKHIGFNVFTFNFNNDFKYPGFKYKLLNFIHKNILFDKGYKTRLKKELQYNKIAKEIEQLQEVDYSLTIRADLFSPSLIHKIKNIAKKNYAYQWDGLSVFEGITPLIPLFDKFYVFDKNDVVKGKTFPTTNFYFDSFDNLFEEKEPEYDFFYIGSYDKRVNDLLAICDYLYSENYKLNIILRITKKNKNDLKTRPYITFITETTSYLENLNKVANTKFLIDLKQDATLHQGLSLRIFDALGHDKKIITTNQIIKNYDFYDAQNIFYLNESHDLSNIANFLNSPYKEIDSSIKKKYSFTNWIKYILEIDDHTDIEIP